MDCFLCGGKGFIEQHKGRSLCKKCFCAMLEKRIRKYARVNRLFKKGDRVLVIGDVNKALMESILKDFPVELFFRKKEANELVRREKINKIVIQWTMDDEINVFIKELFYKKKAKKMPLKYIKLLKPTTDREIKAFSEIKKIKFKENGKDKLVQIFLDDVEKKHPNIKYNLLKNIEMLNRLT